jgi:hypothetical protein
MRPNGSDVRTALIREVCGWAAARFPADEANSRTGANPMITDTFLDQITTVVSRAGLSADSVAALRDAFPDLHFTYCLDDDIGVGIEPVRSTEDFNLYLVNGSDHCVRFTPNLEAATGLVLAEVDEG